MTRTVTLPTWLFVLILIFAAVTLASHFLLPSVRWFFRRRLERAVARLNERLEIKIEPFKLLARRDMIQRLIYDTEVIAAVQAHARETGVPEEVAHEEARAYAREIVPSFSASLYFGIAIRLARWLSTRLYHVRIVGPGIGPVDPDATVVFVMNHRSNMDYVLVTYLTAPTSALSYAVGEWARVWPVSRLFRAMGAYFIRRRSRGALYRRVLARYVQMAVAGGVSQAIFPEGALSLDGRVGAPKLGLLGYIAETKTERDVVFVPVSLNYDRVIEDNVLIEARLSEDRRFRGSFATGSAFALRWLWHRVRGRARRFGYAAVAFGEPVSLKAHRAGGGDIGGLGAVLMNRVRAGVPVLPVPIVAAAVLDGAENRADLRARVADMHARLTEGGVPVHLRKGNVGDSVDAGLSMLVLRGLVTEDEAGRIAPVAEAGQTLRFYAATVPEPDAAAQRDMAQRVQAAT